MTLSNTNTRVTAHDAAITTLQAAAAAASAQGVFLQWRDAANSTGTATFGSLFGSRFPCLTLPDAASTTVNWWVPDAAMLGWATFNLDIVHGATSTGAGNVFVTVTDSVVAADGDATAGDATLFAAAAVAIGNQSIMKVTRMAAGVAVVTGGQRHIRVNRAGADASDTATSPWGIMGLVLSKAS